MNTYLFIETERHVICPTLQAEVTAPTVKQAIKAAEYYPFSMDSYVDQLADTPRLTFRQWEETVFAYYGLVEGINSYDKGNGQDGDWNIIVCIPDGSDPTKLTHLYPLET